MNNAVGERRPPCLSRPILCGASAGSPKKLICGCHRLPPNSSVYSCLNGSRLPFSALLVPLAGGQYILTMNV